MANTVSILSYANTFGEWVVNTNALAKENNDFAANNFTKPTGTLFLNDPSLGLQIANNAIFGGQLQVTGIGSSGYVQNNLRVDGQVYFTNTSIGLVVSSQANIGGPLFATGSGTGLSVANNAHIGGTLNVVKNVSFANNLLVTGRTTLSNTANISGAVNVDNFLTVTANAVVEGAVYTDYLIANNRINTPRVVVSALLDATLARVDADIFYANSTTLQTAYINVLQSNTSINAAVVNSNSAYAQTITTPRLNITDVVDGNSATIYANNIQTLGQLSVGGNFVINGETVYNSNTFTLNSGGIGADISSIKVNRGADGSNAEFRWNEPLQYWDIKTVSSNTYYRVLTTETLVNGLTSTSTTSAASAAAANTLNNTIVAANTFLQAAVNSSGSYANSAFAHANGAYAAANNVAPQIEPAFNKANSGYARANTSLNTVTGTTGSATPTSGGMTFTSNNGVNIVGTSGNALYFNTAQDLRTTGSPTFASMLLTAPLAITQGGTGATSISGALTTLLPSASGVPAGYVLATGGVGTYYWTAGGTGGGGGATPGTTINSTRLFPTVNTNQTIFTTPTYVVGANQLRVYIDGVRQMNSDYEELNSTSIQLGSAIPAGSVIMIEVDGYINNPYFANNITFTAPSGDIPSSANTIQLALESLEARKATLGSPTFTGVPASVTAPANTSNTMIATTAFVENKLNNSNTYTHSISGNAGSVTNGVYTNGSYSNPSWITQLAGSKINGAVASATSATSATNATNSTNATYLSDTVQINVITTANVAGNMAKNDSTASFEVRGATGSGDTSMALMRFHSPGAYGTKLGLRSDGYFGLGGWSSNTWQWYVSSTGDMTAAGNVTAYSDPRLKEGFSKVQNPLGIIAQLDGGTFTWKQGYQHTAGKAGKLDYGILANQVEAVMPEIVSQSISIDGQSFKTVAYDKLIPVLIEAIKELKAEVDALKGNNQ
jgi:hypothetical protein